MDVKRLLKKKGWTGEETGKALILDIISSYKSGDQKALFPREKLIEMINGFSESQDDVEDYNRYINLQNWIMQYQAVANANLQRFNSCYNEFISIHNAAESAENEYRYIEQLPRIVTQKQYDELKAKRIKETVSSGLARDVFQLIAFAAEYYGNELKLHPKAANPLKTVKKAYENKPVESKELVAAFCRITGEGYYQLPDGTRSDQVESEEWQKRLLEYDPELARLEAEGEEGVTGLPGSEAFKRITSEARAAHRGEPLPKAKDKPAKWFFYEELQEELTKWDVISHCIDTDCVLKPTIITPTFALLYPCLLGDRSNEETTAQAEAFNKEFPELVKAITAELVKLGFKVDVPLKDWWTTVYPYSKLYDDHFPGFREYVESDLNVFDGDPVALINGVAILRPSDFLRAHISLRLDKKGYYKEPKVDHAFSDMFGLSAYTPDNPESGDNIDRIERTRAALDESLRFLLAYDTALHLIAKEIDIPDFEIFKAYSSACVERVEALNTLFDLLYTHIAEIDYIDKEKKAAKLQALKDVFYPIETPAISEERKAEAARMLKRLEAFGDGRSGTSSGYNFLALLAAKEGGEG